MLKRMILNLLVVTLFGLAAASQTGPVMPIMPIMPPSMSPPAQNRFDQYPNELRASLPIVNVPPPRSPAEAKSAESSILERIYDISTPDAQQPVEVDRLNSLISRLGRELQLLNEKSREILYDKIKGVTQIKKLRDGLKFAYADMYSIQTSLMNYQQQLKDLQEYLKANKSRIVIVDSNRLGQLYNLVQNLQCVAENMVSGGKKSPNAL